MIARILFFRMAWCEQHPGLMLVGAAVTAFAGTLVLKVIS